MFAPVWKGYFPDELHVGYVTNGVHMPTWAATEVKKFYADKLGTKLFEDQSNRKCWEGIQNVSDEEIWNLRMTLKNKLIDYIRVQYKDSWLKNQGDPSKVVSILEKINECLADRFRSSFRYLQACALVVHGLRPFG